MREGDSKEGMTWETGGKNQKSSTEASGAESEAARHSEKAEQTARENEAREKMIEAFATFQGEAQKIPLDDITLYSEHAQTYIDAINDPDNNLVTTDDGKLERFVGEIIKEAETISRQSEEVEAA